MASGALRRKLERIATHGWFYTPGRAGDRTLRQQLSGLDPLMAEIQGREVLDVGCAEGLISMECAKRGAASVLGIEIVAGHVAVADTLKGDLPVAFEVQDANVYEPVQRYDVVLMLALLHKLRDPSAACARFAAAARALCVIRLGPNGEQSIVDARSQYVRQDIGGVMRGAGFTVERCEAGPFDEATWYYRRQFEV
jgi:2-polyprenyl-3-methyl-5-hydroxy-6-metoxy-1,4-benzoquinol methylase